LVYRGDDGEIGLENTAFLWRGDEWSESVLLSDTVFWAD